jgi:prefoldin subunit 5
MSTSQTDPVVPENGNRLGVVPDVPISDIAARRTSNGDAQAEASGSQVQWVNSELHTIASTIEQLQSRLEEANTRLDGVAKVESTEVEIGRLFVDAQRFCDESLSKLESKVQEILVEAETKANQMLTEAREEAQEIRRQAQQAAFASSQTVRELQSAILGFTRVNADLLTELGTLNSMLLPDNHPGQIGIDPASGAPHLNQQD